MRVYICSSTVEVTMAQTSSLMFVDKIFFFCSFFNDYNLNVTYEDEFIWKIKTSFMGLTLNFFFL